jgi:hypothetical protein
MAEIRETRDLDQPSLLGFARRSWVFQRVGWALLTAFLAAAILGVVGPGPLSRATAEAPGGGLSADLERFVHADTRTRIDVRFGPTREGRAFLWLDRSYAERIQIEGVMPTPASVASSGGRLIYAFDIVEPLDSLLVSFHVKIESAGALEGRLGLQGGPSLVFKQFVWP